MPRSAQAVTELDPPRLKQPNPNSRQNRRRVSHKTSSSHQQDRALFVSNLSSQDQLPCVGVDVASEKFDVCLNPQQAQVLTFANDPDGVNDFVMKLPAPGSCVVILESTGHYHKALVSSLCQVGHLVSVVNPRQVKDFAKGMNLNMKTDKIDARKLALFGWHVQPRLFEKAPEKQAELRELIVRRRQLLDYQTAEKNRYPSLESRHVRYTAQQLLKTLRVQIEELDAEVQRLIDSDDDFVAKAGILTSIPGVARNTAAAIIAELPELGQLNREQIAALVGVAPYNNDSGKFQGQRTIRGGRKDLRSSLFMAAHNARMRSPSLKAFYQRLRERGKPYRKVMVAVIRKLLIIMNTMLKTKTHDQNSPVTLD